MSKTIRQKMVGILNEADNKQLIGILQITMEEIEARMWLGKMKVK